MRSACGIVAACSLLGALALADVACAQEPTPIPPHETRIVGLWLTTDYPVLSEPMGKDVKLSLALENKQLPPVRVALSVKGLPDGWEWKFTGDNRPVGAAIVDSDSSVKLGLDLTPPKGAEAKTYGFMIIGKSEGRVLELPVSLSLTAAEPASVTIEPKLPALRGTPKSTFDYQVTVRNEGAEEQLFNLLAQSPPGFQVVFKEQYGSQELTSLPVKAGESKDLKVSVTPANDAAAGQYPMTSEHRPEPVCYQRDFRLIAVDLIHNGVDKRYHVGCGSTVYLQQCLTRQVQHTAHLSDLPHLIINQSHAYQFGVVNKLIVRCR